MSYFLCAGRCKPFATTSWSWRIHIGTSPTVIPPFPYLSLQRTLPSNRSNPSLADPPLWPQSGWHRLSIRFSTPRSKMSRFVSQRQNIYSPYKQRVFNWSQQKMLEYSFLIYKESLITNSPINIIFTIRVSSGSILVRAVCIEMTLQAVTKDTLCLFSHWKLADFLVTI